MIDPWEQIMLEQALETADEMADSELREAIWEEMEDE